MGSSPMDAAMPFTEWAWRKSESTVSPSGVPSRATRSRPSASRCSEASATKSPR